MVFPREFLTSVLNRTLLIIIENEVILSDEKDRKELAELFSLNIKKKNDWDLANFLIEFNSCLAFFYASHNQPAWMVEHLFEVMLVELSRRVDQHLGAEISKLRYDADFIGRKTSTAKQQRLLGEKKANQTALA